MQVISEAQYLALDCPHEFSLLSYIYFHGVAEVTMGHDLVYSNHRLHFSDCIQDVVGPNGEVFILYAWASRSMQRGLIVSPDDTESVEYALKCYTNQEPYL